MKIWLGWIEDLAKFSPLKAYRKSMDRQMDKSMTFMEHPFYDPVARGKNAPAYSLSGRPREIAQEDEELPEFVIERGPHGTWTRRRVGFLEVHEALKHILARLNRQLYHSSTAFKRI